MRLYLWGPRLQMDLEGLYVMRAQILKNLPKFDAEDPARAAAMRETFDRAGAALWELVQRRDKAFDLGAV